MYNNTYHKYPHSEKTAYGITDSIAELISKHSWMCYGCVSIICFSVLVVVKPEKWYLWLVASPILAWMTAALLLVFVGIEWLVWYIISKTKRE